MTTINLNFQRYKEIPKTHGTQSNREKQATVSEDQENEFLEQDNNTPYFYYNRCYVHSKTCNSSQKFYQDLYSLKHIKKRNITS